ncbi:MAG TPA: hypothetical protein VEF89_29745, partial [Solirubrobacteraceae bacterium]|nr:hypothetical protein [Solirubrobacteraceae bacterium]
RLAQSPRTLTAFDDGQPHNRSFVPTGPIATTINAPVGLMGLPLHILHWLRYRLSPPGGTTDGEQAPARIVFHLSAADTHDPRATRSDKAPQAKSQELAA